MPAIELNQPVRSLILHGQNSSVSFTVYQVDLTTGTPTSLGTGNVGTLLDITDFQDATNTQYLLIRVDVSNANSHTLFGGVLYTDDAGTSPTTFSLRPVDFLINDD